MSSAKIVVAAVWLLCLLAVVLPGSSMLISLGRGLFWLMVAAHAVECLVFLRELRGAPGALSGHLLQAFLFGVLHLRELRASNADAAPES